MGIGLSYIGQTGTTRECLRSILRFLQSGDTINSALILTYEHAHSLLIDYNYDEYAVTAFGFSSNSGEGGKGLATALTALDCFHVEIEEIELNKKQYDKVHNASLTHEELEVIRNAKPIRPWRWHDYIFNYDGIREKSERDQSITQNFRSTIPYALLDKRIVDLSIDFYRDPDKAIISAFRRLEDIVRARIDEDSLSGSRLFSKAFRSEKSALQWETCDKSEQAGRAELFTGTYQSYRNPRAHKLSNKQDPELVREFLAVNELFHLESQAVKRAEPEDREAQKPK